ncbi:MAG: adenylate/guanylate cyclase domain-containing protein [Mariprofundaceae bacterium]
MMDKIDDNTKGEIHRPAPITSFLPVETVEMIMEYGKDFPENLAHEEYMSVLFTDMRGFTELSEVNDARQVYHTINASISEQARIILKHGGSINKFLGDGILACFSGSERVARSLACVLELIVTLKAIEEKSELLPCPVGFGLNDGHVLFGLLGTGERKEFTVIGDVVNTAARLCGIAGPFQALITEQAVQALPENTAEKHCRFFKSQHFKGKFDPTNVYSVHESY